MRYNKEIQKLADQCAQEEDYLCASYLGKYKDSFVFEPMYEDNSPDVLACHVLYLCKTA